MHRLLVLMDAGSGRRHWFIFMRIIKHKKETKGKKKNKYYHGSGRQSTHCWWIVFYFVKPFWIFFIFFLFSDTESKLCCCFWCSFVLISVIKSFWAGLPAHSACGSDGANFLMDHQKKINYHTTIVLSSAQFAEGECIVTEGLECKVNVMIILHGKVWYLFGFVPCTLLLNLKCHGIILVAFVWKCLLYMIKDKSLL